MKSSTDIWFIAYLLLNQEKINDFVKLDRNKVRCNFEISEEKWHQYKLSFNNSEYIKFKALIEQVKDLSF